MRPHHTQATNGAHAATNSDVPDAVAEQVSEPGPDALAGRVCSRRGCEAPAGSVWGRGFLCPTPRLELNGVISERRKRPKAKPVEPVEQEELLEPVARRLVPAARRVDEAAQAYRQACRQAHEAKEALRAARDGWRGLLAEVDGQAGEAPAGELGAAAGGDR